MTRKPVLHAWEDYFAHLGIKEHFRGVCLGRKLRIKSNVHQVKYTQTNTT